MAIDYLVLAGKGKALVKKNGRAITFRMRSRTPADSLKPWRGPSPTAVIEVPTYGVFVPPSSANLLGQSVKLDDLVKRSEAIIIVAPGSDVVDLSNYDEIVDGGVSWHVKGVEKLQPADTILLYFFGVGGA